MTEAILVALITGGLSLAGVVITCQATARKSEKNLAVTQAVMQTELAALTREVRAHNHFAQRMPVVEQRIETINAQIRELKSYHRPGNDPLS